MELQEIEVSIAPDGTTRIEVRGASGLSCLDLTADLEAALGGEVTEREMTADAQATLEQQLDSELRRKSGA